MAIQLSVVVPAYNEAERLPPTLRRLQGYLSASRLAYEIIVVLDGSTDATPGVLRRMSGEIDHLRIIDRPANRGKGYTVKEGMLRAAGRIRLFTDADNSTDISHWEAMAALFEHGSDLVIASRNPRDAAAAEQTVPQAAYKRAIGQLGNRIVQSLAVPGIWDTQCGFKAFRAEAAERIFGQTTVDRWGFDIEVLALAQALNYKIGIIPARWVNDERSHVRAADYLGVLADIVRIRRNFRTGKYRV